MRWRLRVVLAVLVLVGLLIVPVARVGASARPVEPGPEELRALAYVNELRGAIDLPPMTYSPALGMAANSHARYLVENREYGHDERAGAPLFTGAGPVTRSTRFGYAGGVAEVIHYVGKAEEAIDGWMETLYHRLLILDPTCSVMGYGQYGTENRANVLDAGCDLPSGTEVAWPYPGQTGVPTQWTGGEVPDPLRLYPGANGPVGYTITLRMGGRKLTLDAAALTTADGTEVPVMQFTPDRDRYLTDVVGLIPYAPLLPGRTYWVRLEGRVDYGQGLQPYRREWSFTTAAEDPLRLSSASYTTGHASLRGAGFHDGVKVFLNGLPVRNLQVSSPDRLSFDTPQGYSGERGGLLLVSPGGQEMVWPQFAVPAPSGETALAYRTGLYTLIVGGRAATVVARFTPEGVALIPESAMRQLGASEQAVPELRRTYWQWGGRSGDLLVGSVAAAFGAAVSGAAAGSYGLDRVRLPLPPQVIDGELHVPAAFAEALFKVRGLSDIGSHWAREAVTRLVEAGVVSGYPDGTFRPDESLSRAAFVKMLVSSRKLPLSPGGTGGFTDAAGHWLTGQGYLGAAVQAGIVLPPEYPGGRFEPDRPITREEIAVMLVRALGLEGVAQSTHVAAAAGPVAVGGRSFIDTPLWGRPGYIALAVQQGLVMGYPESKTSYSYRPANPATRAEAAAILCRMLWPGQNKG